MRRQTKIHTLLKITLASICLVLVGTYIYTTNTVVTKSSQQISPASNSSVMMDDNEYYPAFLPYQSDTVLSIPIRVPNGTIDPTSYNPLKASGFHNEYISPGNRLFMVQYKTARTLEQNMDARPVRIFPENTHIIQASVKELRILIQNPDVNFVDQYHPHYKLSSELIKAYYSMKITADLKLRIYVSPFALPDEVKHAVKLASGTLVSSHAKNNSYVINGLNDRQKLLTLSLHPLISEIQIEN
jgi:hypothetical protein